MLSWVLQNVDPSWFLGMAALIGVFQLVVVLLLASTNVHIFIDHSNLLYGCSNARAYRTRGRGRGAPVIDFHGLLAFLRSGARASAPIMRLLFACGCVPRSLLPRAVATAYVAGSAYPESHHYWDSARAAGFSVRMLTKNKMNREEAVDDVIHKAMATSLLRISLFKRLLMKAHLIPKDVIVLVSGDGNHNKGHLGFPELVRLALNEGVNVEVYSLRQSFSKRYAELEEEYAGYSTALCGCDSSRVSLCALDDSLDEFVLSSGAPMLLSGETLVTPLIKHTTQSSSSRSRGSVKRSGDPGKPSEKKKEKWSAQRKREQRLKYAQEEQAQESSKKKQSSKKEKEHSKKDKQSSKKKKESRKKRRKSSNEKKESSKEKKGSSKKKKGSSKKKKKQSWTGKRGVGKPSSKNIHNTGIPMQHTYASYLQV
jgi:hypothetical protein